MPTKNMKRSFLVGVVSCLLAAGCESANITDKTGSNVIVLRLATIDDLNPNGQTVAPEVFLSALERVSGGRIRATVQPMYEDGAVTAETDIVKAIAAGELDGGWPVTRAFSRAGIRGLEPIEAPFMLTSYAAQKELVTGPGAQTLLKTLGGSGVVGLGLTVGPLRRPWSTTQALVAPHRWHGVTFRSYNSPVQARAIRSLGAQPVAASFNFRELVRVGKLQAVETDVAQYVQNGYGPLLPHAVSNEVLWPRMMVLSVSQQRFDSLTPEQQGWLRDAAQEAVLASVNFGYDDSALVESLCGQGVRFVAATPSQLAALQRAVQPVITGLAGDPATAASLAQVQKVAAAFPSADALNVPATCHK